MESATGASFQARVCRVNVSELKVRYCNKETLLNCGTLTCCKFLNSNPVLVVSSKKGVPIFVLQGLGAL